MIWLIFIVILMQALTLWEYSDILMSEIKKEDKSD